MKKNDSVRIILLGMLFFMPFLGGVHLFDWDEINFAECAREMVVSGNYSRPTMNFQPFWEKPPFFFWLQAASMNVFGVGEYAARFPNALCGIATLLTIFAIGKKHYNRRFAWWWVLLYFGSVLPHLYFKSGIIDPWFNLFIFLSLYFLLVPNQQEKEQTQSQLQVTNTSDTSEIASKAKDTDSKRIKDLLIAGIFSGLAILTKGPVGYLIAALTFFSYLTVFRKWTWERLLHWVYFSIAALLVMLLWFGIEIIHNGWWFMDEFIKYQLRLAKTEDAGHGGFIGYHPVILFFGCFPASIFALRTLFSKHQFDGENLNVTRWMKTLFWVVLILFSVVQSKIVHYSSMCYLPLTYLAALNIYKIDKTQKFNSWIRNGILVLGILIGLVATAVPYLGVNIHLLDAFIEKDSFTYHNLDAQVHWTYWQSIPGLILLATVLLSLTHNLWTLRKRLTILFIGTALFVQTALISFIGRVEGYSQNAAIEFYKSKVTENCQIETYSFHTYAPPFYTQKKPTNNNTPPQTTYLVAKINSKPELDAKPDLAFLYAKNGFIFYQKRK
jgi:4-amino-4-deoxy-L-arabinose transferase-like glycosyltransferase